MGTVTPIASGYGQQRLVSVVPRGEIRVILELGRICETAQLQSIPATLTAGWLSQQSAGNRHTAPSRDGYWWSVLLRGAAIVTPDTHSSVQYHQQ